MANENLKIALRDQGLTPEEFADVLKVDPKSVQRWLAGTATPYPRHRAKIARALNLTEHHLWPELIDHAADASVEVNEVTGTRAATKAQGHDELVRFIQAARTDLDVSLDDISVPITSELANALVRQAEGGQHIRLLTNDTVRELEPLIAHRHVELRYAHDVPRVMVRAGGRMLAVFSFGGGYSMDGLLVLERRQDDGWFDHLADSFEREWSEPREIITSLDQFNRLVQAHDDAVEEDRLLDEQGYAEADSDEPSEPDDPHGESERPAGTEPAAGQRRWPRRPD
jgi:transcriptional regulator with XRE-family HTH domain